MSPKAVKKPRDKHFTTILLAAQEEFATHGLKGARMQAIADRAGLPKANVHYYFKNKVSLYLAVLDNIIATWDDFLNDVNVDDDPAIALDTFIRAKVRLSFENPTASRLFANEILQGAPYLSNYISEVLRPRVINRTKVIEEWMNAGKMAATDPVLLIFMIWATTQHYADFQAQELGIMGRKEYDDDLINQVSNFTSQTILRGCGLEPPNTNARGNQ